MNLYLRKAVHPQAHDNYRVILKLDDTEVEIGSIGNPDQTPPDPNAHQRRNGAFPGV